MWLQPKDIACPKSGSTGGGGTELRLQHQLGLNPGPTMAQLYDLGQVTEPQPHLEMG